MPYAKVYKGEFLNTETTLAGVANQQLITVEIQDTESGIADNSAFVALQMADVPLRITILNNNEDKFDPAARSKRATVQVHTSNDIGIETFIDGGDNRYKVVIYSQMELLFIGWLSISDIAEDNLPDPNILSLIATDGLGFLNDEQLTDLDGSVPTTERTLMEFLIMALAKTGNQLGFAVAFNIRESAAATLNADTTGAGHFLKHEYLDSRTFEGEIGECEKAINVVNKILGEEACLMQKNGLWYIWRVDEMQNGEPLKLIKFDAEGNYTGTSSVNFNKAIGTGSPMQWMNDDSVKSAERPLKSVELTYKYESFKEAVCNIDLSRGTGPEPTNAESEDILYTPQCIEYLREDTGSAFTPTDIDYPPYPASEGGILKHFVFDYEKERYLSSLIAGGFRHYFKFSDVFVRERDRIRISFTYRINFSSAITNIFPAVIRLQADDGSLYDWLYDALTGQNEWVPVNLSLGWFTSPWRDDLTGLDVTQWRSIGNTSPDIPKTGRLTIRLVNAIPPPKKMYFASLQVEYIPLINGSYGTFFGHKHTVTQPVEPQKYKAVREKQVYVGDGPGKQTKGALLKRGANLDLFTGAITFNTDGLQNWFQVSGDKRPIFKVGQLIIISGSANNDQETRITSTEYNLIGDVSTIYVEGVFVPEGPVTLTIGLANYVLCDGFYNASVFPDGPPDETFVHPYGELQVFDVWNQFNRVMRKCEGTVDRIQSAIELPDIIHQFELTDPDPGTIGKRFMLLHHDTDVHLCELGGVLLHELTDDEIDKQYTGHDFKYITTNDE